jgi:S1-C subfamily serine protease
MPDDALPASDAQTQTQNQPKGRRLTALETVGIFGGVFVLAVPLCIWASHPKAPQTADALFQGATAEARAPSATPEPTDIGVPLTAEALFSKVSPAVVQVVVQDQQDHTIGRGSGFLVGASGLIATNYHVIEQAHRAHVVVADETRVPVLGVAAYDSDVDIAIVKVAGVIAAPPLELAGAALPPVGAKVYAIGNPLGLSNTLSDGLVSGHREFDRKVVIQVTAPISPGSSGGPLLVSDGKVVGVTTFLVRGGQNLNFSVPASSVVRLLHRCKGEGPLVRFPLVASAYVERGVTWIEQKDHDKAIRDFTEAIRLDPGNAFAYGSRGCARSMEGDYDAAIRDFNEALRLDPTSSSYYASRGIAWQRKKDSDRAIRDFSEAIKRKLTVGMAEPEVAAVIEDVAGKSKHDRMEVYARPGDKVLDFNGFRPSPGYAVVLRYFPFEGARGPGRTAPLFRLNLLYDAGGLRFWYVQND